MKPQGTATYKLQFHPHHQGTAGREGKRGEGFSHGCDWHLGEAEAGMALRGVFLARKNAFLVEKNKCFFFVCFFILEKNLGIDEPPKAMGAIVAFPVGLGDTKCDSAPGFLFTVSAAPSK